VNIEEALSSRSDLEHHHPGQFVTDWLIRGMTSDALRDPENKSILRRMSKIEEFWTDHGTISDKLIMEYNRLIVSLSPHDPESIACPILTRHTRGSL